MIGVRKLDGAKCVMVGLLASVSVFPTYAQEVKPEAAVKDGDIIVTAQRREQALQDVPIAISALGSEELLDRGISDVRSLSSAVPSVSVTGTTGINGNGLFAIRGVSNQASPIGVPQTVAIYVDGEYQPGPFSAFFSLDDVERIEVLRGPQGTLYGRNSSAGAVNVITRMPGDTPRMGFDVSYGNYKHVLAKMSASTPITEGIAAGISGSFERRDGYFTNVVTGNDVGGVESFTLRGKLRLKSADEAFTALLTVDRSEKNGNEAVLYNLYTTTGTYVGLQSNPYAYRTNPTNEARNFGRRRSTGGALTIDLKASDSLTFTSITAIRDEATDLTYDLQGGFPVSSANPPAAVVTKAGKTDNSFSQEVRGQYSSKALDLTIGANYYRNKEFFGLGASLGTLFLPNISPAVNSTLNTFAIFGQAEYHVTEQLTLTAGLRWNNENRDWSVDYTQALSPVTGGALPGTKLMTTGKIKESAFIPSGGIDFKVSDDVMLYAKVSKGYQAPGFNATPGAAVSPAEFRAEQLLAYEGGIKSQFADKRVTLNFSGFFYDYDNLQVRNTIGVGQTSVTNAGRARIKGLEASLFVKPAQGLSLSGNLSWIDAKYKEYCEQAAGGSLQINNTACTTPVVSYTTSTGTVVTTGGAPGWNRAGNSLINAPKWQWNVALNYELPVGDAGDLRASVNYSYSSVYFLNSMNDPLSSSLNATNRLDARLGFRTKGGLEIYAYGKNLTENKIVDFAVRGSPTSVTTHFSDPRTYGLGVQFRF